MFPGAHARIDRNEVGEVLGWDYPSLPYDGDDSFYDIEDDDEQTYCTACEEYVYECLHTEDYAGETADEGFR